MAVVAATLPQSSRLRLLVIGILCLAVLVCHLHYAPIKQWSSRLSQHVLGFCALVVIMVNTATAADSFQTGVPTASTNESSVTLTGGPVVAILGLACAYCVPLAALVAHACAALFVPKARPL